MNTSPWMIPWLNLRKVRLKISQAEAARLLGTVGIKVTRQAIISWESQKTALPAHATFKLRLAAERATDPEKVEETLWDEMRREQAHDLQGI